MCLLLLHDGRDCPNRCSNTNRLRDAFLRVWDASNPHGEIMSKFTNAALGVVVAMSVTAGALYAACTDHIMRLSDGTEFELEQRISRLEGGFGIQIGWFSLAGC